MEKTDKKLYVTDLDGTLVARTEDPIPESLFPLIEEILSRGDYFAVATGRQIENTEQIFGRVSDRIYFLVNNGGSTFYQNQLIYAIELATGHEEELIDDIMKFRDCEIIPEMAGHYVGFTTEDGKPIIEEMKKHTYVEVALPDLHKRTEPLTKISFNAIGRESVDPEIASFFHEKYDGLYEVVESGHGWMDFSAVGSGKGPALSHLAETLGVKKENIIAFGDNENDISMFRVSGLSYARDTSTDFVKSNADRVTIDPVEELKRLLNGESL